MGRKNTKRKIKSASKPIDQLFMYKDIMDTGEEVLVKDAGMKDLIIKWLGQYKINIDVRENNSEFLLRIRK